VNNNDILVKLKHALDIEDADMVEIFKLGGIELSKEEVQKMLIESKESNADDFDNQEVEESIKCKMVR